MRRLARKLLILASALSSVLFLAACVLWVRSSTTAGTARVCTPGKTLVLGMSRNSRASLTVVHGWRWPVPQPYRGSLEYFDDMSGGHTSSVVGTPDSRWYGSISPQRWQVFPSADGASTFISGWSGQLSGLTSGPPVTTSGMSAWSVTVDWWVLAVVTGILPAVVLSPRAYCAFRRRRYPVGHCAQCGYDLRASPNRCPECGAPPAAVAAQ